MLQSQAPEGRQARALGQDAAGRRYYQLGGDAGLTRVFVDAGPSAVRGVADSGSAVVAAQPPAAPAEAVALGPQRPGSVAGGLLSGDLAIEQQLPAPSADQPSMRLPAQQQPQLQPQQDIRRLPEPPGAADSAWGWYEADQLPALLEWLEGGDEGERALADAVFEATLRLLPAPLVQTAPSQACAVPNEQLR